jgi:hypothetical protein
MFEKLIDKFLPDVTLKDVYKRRKYFEWLCKRNYACKEEYYKLITAEYEEEFMAVVYANFNWIHNGIKQFKPKFNAVDDFIGDCCIVINADTQVNFMRIDETFISNEWFDRVYPFSTGNRKHLAVVIKEGRYCLLNKSGKLYETDVIAEDMDDFIPGFKLNFSNVWKYRKIFEIHCKAQGACEEEYTRLLKAENEVDYLKVIEDNFYWIYHNIDVFDMPYDEVNDFYEGRGSVYVNDKWGVIDNKGNWIVVPIFDATSDFSEGKCAVYIGNKWGYINSDGTWLVRPIFDTEGVGDFHFGRASVCREGNWGYIDDKNVFITECKYEEAGDFYEDDNDRIIADVWIDSTLFHIDINGNEILND